MLKKRMRSSNFNPEEEDILVRCILRHAAIIENKKTDSCTLREKQNAWEEIGNEFNALCPNVIRQIKALKDKYTNLKTMLRKQFAAKKASGWMADLPEWHPRSEPMAELALIISNSTHDTTQTVDDNDKANDNDDVIILPNQESCTVETDNFDEKPLDLIEDNQQTMDDVSDRDKNDTTDNSYPIKISLPSTIKTWPKYNTTSLRRQNKFKQKRPPFSGYGNGSGSLPRNHADYSLQHLKRKLFERILEIREIEHQTRMEQRQEEHEARMALLEAQRLIVERKGYLQQLKIAKLTTAQAKSVKAEVDSDE